MVKSPVWWTGLTICVGRPLSRLSQSIQMPTEMGKFSLLWFLRGMSPTRPEFQMKRLYTLSPSVSVFLCSFSLLSPSLSFSLLLSPSFFLSLFFLSLSLSLCMNSCGTPFTHCLSRSSTASSYASISHPPPQLSPSSTQTTCLT